MVRAGSEVEISNSLSQHSTPSLKGFASAAAKTLSKSEILKRLGARMKNEKCWNWNESRYRFHKSWQLQ